MTHNMLEKYAKNVVASPYDSAMVKCFFIEYDRSGKKDRQYSSIYWILKYLHGIDPWESLNALGDLYIQDGKYYLAELCFIESIRLNPSQKNIFIEYENYSNYLNPDVSINKSNHKRMISVIIGTYNRDEELKEAIESVLHQTYEDYEIVLINDGGTEEIEDYVRGLDTERIRYFKLKENRGHAAVLNEGIRRSRGKYIAYLDDDDIYYPNHLATLLAAFDDPARKFVYANTKMVAGSMEEGRFREKKIVGLWDVEFDKSKLLKNNFISNLCVMHEKDLFSDIGLYFDDLSVVMDWEMWLRASLKYKFHHIHVDTGEYRFKDNNVTSTKRLSIDFYTELIRNYYMYYRGLISRMNYYEYNNLHGEAKTVYATIRDQYEHYFRAPQSYDVLLNLSQGYNDNIFTERLAMDYFRETPRNYMQYVKKKRNIPLLLSVSSLMPSTFVRYVRNRTRWGKNT